MMYSVSLMRLPRLRECSLLTNPRHVVLLSADPHLPVQSTTAFNFNDVIIGVDHVDRYGIDRC